MNINIMKRNMTLTQRTDWNIMLWTAIMENCVILYYLYLTQNWLLLYIDVIIMLILFKLMSTNNKEGLKLLKQKKEQSS